MTADESQSDKGLEKHHAASEHPSSHSAKANNKEKKDAWDVIQILLTAFTALFVAYLGWQGNNLTNKTTELKNAFDESNANAQLVATLVTDLGQSHTSDLALIALYHHFRQNGGTEDQQEDQQMVIDLAKAVLRSAATNNTVPNNVELNQFALQIIKNSDAREYPTFLSLISKAQPRPSAKPTAGAAGVGQVVPTRSEQQAQLAYRAAVGAKATVYIEYSVKNVTDPREQAALQQRAEKLGDALLGKADSTGKTSQVYAVADVEPTQIFLTKTSVRYYSFGDVPLANELTSDVAHILDIPIPSPHYNGPANVPQGQLEVWMAEHS